MKASVIVVALLSAAISVDAHGHSLNARGRASHSHHTHKAAAKKHQATPKKANSPIPKGYTSPKVLPVKLLTGDGGWQDAVSKAKKFVGKLTLEEKVNLTTGVGTGGRCVGNTGTVPRIGFNGFCLEDSPLGVRDTDYASAFPAGINAAATWDKNLIFKRGQAMGQEHRGKGVNVALGPMMNMGRVAAGGRNWEGFGGDPYLTAVASVETINGIQGQGVIACAKHFIGNEQEHFRGGGGGQASSSDIDDRTLHEIYAWPFAASVEAGVGSVMCSYNRINQTYACENSKILNGIMKEELDFQGFMLSDWAAIESGAPSANAGTDIDMPSFFSYALAPGNPNPVTATNSWYGANLLKDVKNGSVSETRLNDMVERLMAAYYKMGQDSNYPAVNFDYNTEDTYLNGQKVNEHKNVQGNHAALIREIDAASTILLKNTKNALPLDLSKLKQLAIIGSDAGPNPNGSNSCPDRGCDEGTLAMGWGSGTANFPVLVDPYSAIQTYIHKNSPKTVVTAILDDYAYDQVAAVGAQSDACMVFVNSDSGEGYITVGGNAGDRNNLTFWHGGDALVMQTANNCKNTIVVTHAVGPTLVEEWINHPNVTALLWAGIPGQETGNGLLDVITGTVNPSGRLPYTIAKQRSDYPADVVYTAQSATDIPQLLYSEGLEIDYRHFDAKNITPRYEFGFGLSYTTFEYSKLSVTHTAKAGAVGGARKKVETNPGGVKALFDSALTATVQIANTGNVDGNEVPQLYVTYPASAKEPPRVLRGFERVLVSAGKTQSVTFNLINKDLSIWDVVKQQWVIPSGTYKISVGASSRDIRETYSFKL